MATDIKASKGTASMSLHAKREVAESMYDRGQAFIAAAILLHPHATREAHHYVFLHLLCQGIEVTLKGLLLLAKYRSHKQLRKDYGHCLRKVADAVLKEYGLNALKSDIAVELDRLGNFYSAHHFRYASGVDFFFDPTAIPYKRVMARLVVAMKLVERAKKRNAA